MIRKRSRNWSRKVDSLLHQGSELERRTIQRQITFQHPDPYAIASAPDTNSPGRNNVSLGQGHLLLRR